MTIVPLAVVIVLSACLGPSRERAIKDAIQQVKETMDVALTDMTHPEPYKYTGGGGDCAWVPELPSSKETLRYQAEIALPPGDDGRERQARAVQHWIDKGGTLRSVPYVNGPAREVDYRGGSILAFAMPTRGQKPAESTQTSFYIVATTPCVSKEE